MCNMVLKSIYFVDFMELMAGSVYRFTKVFDQLSARWAPSLNTHRSRRKIQVSCYLASQYNHADIWLDLRPVFSTSRYDPPGSRIQESTWAWNTRMASTSGHRWNRIRDFYCYLVDRFLKFSSYTSHLNSGRTIHHSDDMRLSSRVTTESVVK